MSQDFRELIGTDFIKNDRETINKNFWDLRSCSAGTAAPTNNLVVGMTFFNTNTKKLYRLMSDLTTWTLEADFSSGVVVVPQAGSATDADKATNDANGKALTDYVTKLEQSQDNAFVINVYDGNNKVVSTITIPETKMDVMQGATSNANGAEGLVPAPSAGKNNQPLCGDGTFKVLPIAGGGTGAITAGNARTNLGLSTAVTAASISGRNITLTKADGTTQTLTTQDSSGPFTSRATSIGGASTTVPAVVVTSYKSGATWYRVWSDGWKEQGGTGNFTAVECNVTFPRAFSGTDYAFVYSKVRYASKQGVQVHYKRTTTNVQCIASIDADCPFYWYACGY